MSETITVVHKITNLVETVPVSYYEELKDVYRPIKKTELDALKNGKATKVDEPLTPNEIVESEPDAQEGAK